MKVQVQKGKRVRHPDTKLVLKEGQILNVVESTYWYRRIQDGDVVEVKEETPSPKK